MKGIFDILARETSRKMTEGREPPAADAFDEDKYPFAKKSGDNKFGFTKCPACGKSPTELSYTRFGNAFPRGAFLFCNELSAREYEISGLCQNCQALTFKEVPDVE